jgi:autoinducer 2-binding protein LuxP
MSEIHEDVRLARLSKRPGRLLLAIAVTLGLLAAACGGDTTDDTAADDTAADDTATDSGDDSGDDSGTDSGDDSAADSGDDMSGPDTWPLIELDDDADRDHWLPQQVNEDGTLEALQEIVGSEAVPFSGTQDGPVRIAFVYPSADTSDFWARNTIAFLARLDELGIEYETTEFATRQIEHDLQATYAVNAAQDEDLYDYVIFGPSELAIQQDAIETLASKEGFQTYIWAFHTPLKDLEHQPDAWFDFSSAAGALEICDYVVERLGEDVQFAAIRGIPGITDDQRSGDFIECVEERANWSMENEFFGDYTDEGGFNGTNGVIQAFPEITFIHNANTAMALGSVEAQVASGVTDNYFTTGWGGTGLELDSIREGTLNATPMRMGDDVGAATAEAIKADLEGRNGDLPRVFLGRITVAHDELSDDELDALQQEAFRFSGVDALEGF